MNWEALGSLGDLLGALGVIATLGYLAVQVRQNTAVVRASNFQSLMASMSKFTGAVAQNVDVAEVYRRGIVAYEGLSESERLRFHALVTDIFLAAQTGYHLQQRGLIDNQLYRNFLTGILMLLRLPGVHQWWDGAKDWWHEDFREFIDAALSPAIADAQRDPMASASARE